MRRNQPLLRALVALSEAPDGELLSGQLTKAQREALGPFRSRSGCISTRRQGSGLVYVVKDPDRLMAEINEISPGRGMDLSCTPARARNIALHRDSKAGLSRMGVDYLPIKAVGSGVAWLAPSQELALSCIPAPHAAFLAISPQSQWASDKPLLLVENRELFDVLDWVPADFHGTIACYPGEAPGWLQIWLKEKPRASNILHFPDYDGVGLSTFIKLRQASLAPVDLYLPTNWKYLLGRFGSRTIYKNTLARFESVFSELCAAGPGCAALALELRRTGLALEQETVLLPQLAVDADG